MTENLIQGVASVGSSLDSYSSDDSDGVYRHTRSRAKLVGVGHNIFTHESQEGEDDTDQHPICASSEMSYSSYQRSVSIDIADDDIENLIQRLKMQEELSK